MPSAVATIKALHRLITTYAPFRTHLPWLYSANEVAEHVPVAVVGEITSNAVGELNFAITTAPLKKTFKLCEPSADKLNTCNGFRRATANH